MFLVNSRLDLFTAPCSHRDPFSRTYGVILPSSLTTLLSLILGFSPHLPVSVYGTGKHVLNRSFSRQCEISYFPTIFRYSSQPRLTLSGFAYLTPSLLDPAFPTAGIAYPPVSLHLSNKHVRYWNINQLSIDYAFRPRLRSRLTPGGRTLPGKPWVFDGTDSHCTFATHASILSCVTSTGYFRFGFSLYTMLPYH